MRKQSLLVCCLLLVLAGIGVLQIPTPSQTVNMGKTWVASQNIRYANEGATGTTVNKLAKLTGAPSTAIITGTADTSGIVGIVVAGAGTTGNAIIAGAGKASCDFDSATTAGHYVKNDASTAGDCEDAGATYPTSGQIIGVVTSTNGGAGTYEVDLSLGQPQAGGTGGGGGASVVTFGSIPGTCTDGTTFYLSDSLYTVVCNPANTFSYFHGPLKVTPPPSAGWTWDNQGAGGTVDSTYGYESLYLERQATAVKLRYRAAPATPYVATALILSDANYGGNWSSTQSGPVLAFRQSTTGKLVNFIICTNFTFIGVSNYTDSATFSGDVKVVANVTGTTIQNPKWMRIEDDGTDLKFYTSIDGQHWSLFLSTARGAFMTLSGGVTGPDQIAFGAYVKDSDATIDLLSWEVL